MAAAPENWETIKALFDAALELPSQERRLFLEKNSPDPVVRAEIERLLSEHDQAGAFLSTPVLCNFALKPEDETHRLSEGELLAVLPSPSPPTQSIGLHPGHPQRYSERPRRDGRGTALL
jgi:hypothetical protein